MTKTYTGIKLRLCSLGHFSPKSSKCPCQHKPNVHLCVAILLIGDTHYLGIFKWQLVMWARQYVPVVFMAASCKHGAHFHETEW